MMMTFWLTKFPQQKIQSGFTSAEVGFVKEIETGLVRREAGSR